MSADLDRLLEEATPEPGGHLDVDALWAAGRRRRAWRLTGAAVASVVAVLLVTGVAVNLASVQPPTVEPLGPAPTATDADDATQEEADPPDPSPLATGDPDPSRLATGDPDPEATAPSIAAPPEPDPAAMDDPCAPHAGREGEAFIDVVSPVDGQQVDGAVELVGCSNVYEANVLYRLLDAGGDVVAEGFTTATCGSGCVGEFREQIALEATGTLTLEVFWEDAADGSARDVVAVTFERT